MKLLMNDEAQFMKLLRFAVGSTSRAEETRGKRGKAAERGQMENVRSGPGPSRRFHQYNCPIVWLDRETERRRQTHTRTWSRAVVMAVVRLRAHVGVKQRPKGGKLDDC